MPTDDDWHRPSATGATPLDADEAEGLRLSWIATRADLNEADQANIVRGTSRPRWARTSTMTALGDKTVRDLHRDMFGDVWRWAGTYRTTEKNLGVDPRTIGVRVRDLCDDARIWFTDATAQEIDEAAYRFHHRLVAIHPFPNGNGRHARAMTDIILRSLGAKEFTWGRAAIDDPGVTRNRYIAALRAADRGELDQLAEFVRS